MLGSAVAGIVLAAALPAASSRLVVGQPVPDFSATGHDGTKVRIGDLRGKRVVIFVWASW